MDFMKELGIKKETMGLRAEPSGLLRLMMIGLRYIHPLTEKN